MKLIILFALSVSLAFCADAQTENNKITIGKVDSVYSEILGEQRKIWVYSPKMQPGSYDTTSRYPVVYLLDGDIHFESVVGMIRQLSEVCGNTNSPQMIVVAIPNTNRTRDLTPTHIVSDLPMMDSNASKSTGGGENFISFMENELMPYIDSAYPVQPYRMLIGHSFGGLAVMNILANHTKLFNAYIAIDPSMWYDKDRFLKATEQKLAQNKYKGIKLYLGIANTIPGKMTVEKTLKDSSEATRHIRSIFALDNFIKQNKQNGLTYASKYYADDDHGSVPMISEYDGFRFIFNYYKLKLYEEDYSDSSIAIATKFHQHYVTVSKEFGYKVPPPEMMINGFGQDALRRKFMNRAETLLKMNLDNYPNSEKANVSYADLLAAKKDTANAIAYYQKGLLIKKNAETQQKLNALQGKEVFKLTKEELKKYAGEYFFETISLNATIAVKDNSLWISSSGQPDFEMIPLSPDTFGMKNIPGFQLYFEMNNDKPVSLTSTQPNGTFKAKFKR